MADLTMLAFDLADRYRNPAVVLADGYVGQMMEPVRFAAPRPAPLPPEWAVTGTAETRHNMITSLFLEPDLLEQHVRKLEAKYQEAERRETRAELWRTEDAEIILVGFGIVGRVLKAVVELGRAAGLKLGLLRPITLYPFPTVQIRELAKNAKAFTVVELSTGQLVDDMRLALEPNKKPRRSGVFCRVWERYFLTPLNSMSTRRFFWRPSAVLLVATGCDSPRPRVLRRFSATPSFTRKAFTAAARRIESFRL
jgi:TPP-dependent indolepyruvate ferredoxin oxidoreductase alpha subunit